jgi:hypothetical protein
VTADAARAATTMLASGLLRLADDLGQAGRSLARVYSDLPEPQRAEVDRILGAADYPRQQRELQALADGWLDQLKKETTL